MDATPAHKQTGLTKPHLLVTAALVRKAGQVLITRRPDHSHFGGLWEFPGGKVEKGESFGACLARELQEELGISVRVGSLLYTAHFEYDDRYVTIYFMDCEIVSGEPRPIGCSEVRWVSIAELNHYPMPPADLEFIHILQQGNLGLEKDG